VGTRLQATVVLTCPGVDLTALLALRDVRARSSPRGFDEELAALHGRLDPSTGRRLEASRRRRRRVVRTLESQGRWVEEEDVRTRLRGRIPLPEAEDFPADDPPAWEDGAELLPLVFDGRAGPVAFAQALGGWDLLELRPTGGVERSLGLVPPPSGSPSLTPEGRAALAGYLRYWLERDCLFGVVHLEMLEGEVGTVTESVESELRRTGALVLSRAYVLAGVHRGEVGPLSGPDVLGGIRAVDQDLLDRRTWGERF
jgi:hypothetical protein